MHSLLQPVFQALILLHALHGEAVVSTNNILNSKLKAPERVKKDQVHLAELKRCLRTGSQDLASQCRNSNTGLGDRVTRANV